jgi:hypothetical protein
MPGSLQELELAERLDRLDPGGCLTVELEALKELFGKGHSVDSVIMAVERFAEEHRCTFSFHGHNRGVPEFVKDDTF